MDAVEDPTRAPPWTSRALTTAALAHVALALAVALFPRAAFAWVGLEPPRYPALFQGLGLLAGVAGVGYGIASLDPRRHGMLVFVGWLGEVLLPLGALTLAARGLLPWSAALLVLGFTLPFAVFLALVLREVWAPRPLRAARAGDDLTEALGAAVDQEGRDLLDRSREGPLLVVFLRHFGCTFCRETLADLAERREALAATGTTIALVHMSPDEDAGPFFARYGLADVPRVSDPTRWLYQAFGLARGRLGQLFGGPVWVRGFVAGVLRGHGVGKLQGDGLQMPGTFLVREGRVLRAYVHRTAADRPDYAGLAAGGPRETAPA